MWTSVGSVKRQWSVIFQICEHTQDYLPASDIRRAIRGQKGQGIYFKQRSHKAWQKWKVIRISITVLKSFRAYLHTVDRNLEVVLSCSSVVKRHKVICKEVTLVKIVMWNIDSSSYWFCDTAICKSMFVNYRSLRLGYIYVYQYSSVSHKEVLSVFSTSNRPQTHRNNLRFAHNE